jgi:hypothetical protein
MFFNLCDEFSTHHCYYYCSNYVTKSNIVSFYGKKKPAHGNNSMSYSACRLTVVGCDCLAATCCDASSSRPEITCAWATHLRRNDSHFPWGELHNTLICRAWRWTLVVAPRILFWLVTETTVGPWNSRSNGELCCCPLLSWSHDIFICFLVRMSFVAMLQLMVSGA